MRQLPDPAILLMHGDLAAVKPAWGPCQMWRWWGWRDANPANGVYKWETIDSYLDACAAQGRKAAISVLLYPDLNQDTTPAWVYNGGLGWPIAGGFGTFPKWNDYAWDVAMSKFIAAFGARYDGDPRLHSVWLTFARYGETVTSGLGSDLHNPGRYFVNVINWYDAAFPNTPLCALITGPTDRLALADLCWQKGIVVKLNALVKDAPPQVQLRPTPGSGHAEIAHKAMGIGQPTAWEHFYPNNAKETYWAMLTFVGLGGTVLDLPAAHLDALAAVPGLWAWVLEAMSVNQELVGFYAARDTQYPAPGNGWEHGWPGAWERNITTGATCYAPGSAGYKAAPVTLTSTLEGHGGIGWCPNGLTVTATLPEGEYSVETTYAPATGDNWITHYMVTTLPGNLPIYTNPCWVHRVVALPYEAEPEPPPPPPDPLDDIRANIDDLSQIMREIESDQGEAKTRIDALVTRLDEMAGRIATLEDSKAAALSALEQLRESLV
jgi:hypothetical protein